jgi:hypothetical protein
VLMIVYQATNGNGSTSICIKFGNRASATNRKTASLVGGVFAIFA